MDSKTDKRLPSLYHSHTCLPLYESQRYGALALLSDAELSASANLMDKKSIWSIIKERDFGEPVILITKINHFKGDDNRNSYTVFFPEKGDFDSNVKSINRLWLPILLKVIVKRFTSHNKG